VVGGVLDRRAMVATGAATAEAYGRVAADVCLLGVWSVHAEHGLSERYPEEADLRRVLLGRADRVVGLATADKLGTVAPFRIGPASALTHLVCEAAAPPAATAPLAELGVALVAAA
jgi:DeoR/GlpR family transcriptional regulator of sugar metabolism